MPRTSESVALGAAVPKFCPECGSAAMEWRVPEGDERPRAVCGACGHVEYANPKVVCGCVVRCAGGFVLARRAIEPRRGRWGFPQGYMELGETTRECACREALEETGLRLDPGALRLLAIYNLPNQVQIVYEAWIDEATAEASRDISTKESSEIRLFAEEELPGAERLAFPTVAWALDFALETMPTSDTKPATTPSAGVALAGVVQQRTKAYDPESGEWAVVAG